MVDTTYNLDVIISKFFRIRYIKGTTNEDFTDYLIDFTFEKELEKMLDKLEIVVSRRISDEAWFDGFDPDVEILLQYGSKYICRGRVKDTDLKQGYNVEIYSSAEIASRKVANIVYNNQSPESIFSDLISTYTDLTPQTPNASNTIIDRFTATEYIDSLIKKLAEILDWQIRCDGNKNIYLEPRGNTTNSNTIYRTASTHNALFGKWKEFHNELANRLIIVGDKVHYYTTEYFDGDDSTVSFALAEVPIDIVVYISDVEQDINDYSITATDRTITFNTAPTTGSENIKINYIYSYPIYCDKKDQTSIDTNGEFVKKMWLPWIKSRKDAINYALEYIEAYKNPLTKNTLVLPIKELANYNVGEEVRIDDDLEGIDDNYLIHKITARYTKGYMKMEVGNAIPTFSTSQGMIMSRIKELEKNTDVVAQLYASPSETITITETFDDSDIDYLNHKVQGTYPPRCNYGRGTLYDARVGLCQVKG